MGTETIIAEPYGIVLRTNGGFRMKKQSPQSVTYYLKVIAGTIEIEQSPAIGQTITFAGGFGPPDVFQLGLLE